VLYLLGGFFMAATVHYARRIPVAEKPLEVRGFHLIRELLFALGFLLVVLLVSEPFLASGSQKVETPFRLHLPMVGGVAPVGNNTVDKTLMNSGILLTLLLFFVLQGLIYIACLVKLAEIRRQRVPPHTKLKLLENEEHLFDAGLYLGFVGTIVSLILVSLNVIHFSLMAAYSCTCFGIVFVVIFKIFHLRSARRQLLLEAEAESRQAATPTTHAYAAPV
jgi:formate/nitrite transporter FocA (FNT family)